MIQTDICFMIHSARVGFWTGLQVRERVSGTSPQTETDRSKSNVFPTIIGSLQIEGRIMNGCLI